MAPLFELAHVEALKAAKFNILVYPISSTDVLKFSEEHALLLYANAPAFKQILRQNSIKYLFENRSLLLWGALSGWSDLFKFRDAILDSMHNFVLRRLLHRPFDFETHYWKQQPELSLSSTLVQFQFGYAWQSSAYFDKKLAETRTQLKELGRLLQQENIKLMFYEMPGYCQSYETYVTNRAKRAAQNFSEQLMELSRENSSIFHVKSGPLPADECAETFHVNDKGRARIAAELTPVIQSLLDKGRL